MSGPAPEVGQARVRAQLAAEGRLPGMPSQHAIPVEEGADVGGATLYPENAPVNPIVEALQTLPDADLLKLAESYNIKVSGGRNNLIRSLAALGLGPKNLK
jgi:hypothetical protein